LRVNSRLNALEAGDIGHTMVTLESLI
jgi:hypothetical protein